MESGEPEFQIAPMIDCLLVLLIFFMSITTTQVLQIDQDIELPIATDAKEKDKKLDSEGALNVKWAPQKQKRTYTFEGLIFDDGEEQKLVDMLAARRARDPKYRVIIRGDQRMPAIEIQRTMNLLAQAGLDDIAFSALNK